VTRRPAAPEGQGSVTVYAPNADGDAAPIRTILGAKTELNRPRGIAVDPRGTVYVAHTAELPVLAFSPGASGNVAPVRQIGRREMVTWSSTTGFSGSRDPAEGQLPTAVALDPHGRVHVTSGDSPFSGGTAAVYDTAAATPGPPWRVIAGRATGLGGVSGIAVGADGTTYVANREGRGSVTVYAADASGDAAPIRTIAGSETELYMPTALALDARGNLYVANQRNAVTVYGPGAVGNVAPLRTVAGPSTGLSSPTGIAVDRRGYVYVANDTVTKDGLRAAGAVTVYAPGASADARPVRTIKGRATRLSRPSGLAFDGDGNLYVVNGDVPMEDLGSVAVFAPGASGDAAPIRTLVGRDTRLNEPAGVALGADGSLYVANGAPWWLPPILVYSPGADAEVPPVRAIEGPNTLLAKPRGLVLDAAGNLYVANHGGANGINAYGPDLGAVTVYAPGASGDVAPIRTIRGYHARLNGPSGIALDGDTLFVANYWAAGKGSVTVYGPAARGDATPLRIIAGPETGLCGPAAIAIDRHAALYVANLANNTVTMYAPGAMGNVPPIRTLGAP
jgi:sugar lactone lactonase YvrE